MKTFYNFKNKFCWDRVVLNLIANLIFAYSIIIAASLIMFSFVSIECEVSGSSMQPTLNYKGSNKSDTAYVNRFDHDYEYGDIVVVDLGNDKVIKRVIGLPGDTIDFVSYKDTYKLERNGEIIQENYLMLRFNMAEDKVEDGMSVAKVKFEALKQYKPEMFNDFGQLVVQEGEIFVLGDNRHVSDDSSKHGCYKMFDVMGIVEQVKYYGESSFEFYYNYVAQGKFFTTIINLF